MKLWLIGSSLILCTALAAQEPVRKYSFEVASIKAPAPSSPDQIRMSISNDPGRIHYSNLALRDLISMAYRVKTYQVEGPAWIDNTRFEVDAKLPDGVPDQYVPEMLQTMLAERFKLEIHRETKDHGILALVEAKGGAKLKPAENPIAESPGPGRGQGQIQVRVDNEGAHLTASSATLVSVADIVSRFTEQPVMDKTGIDGQYDFDLVVSPEALRPGRASSGPVSAPPPDGGASGPAASASQRPGTFYEAFGKYGLKLDPRKAAMPIVVVDHMEKTPTEN